jgi:cyclic pyranopterin phosphate synthase
MPKGETSLIPRSEILNYSEIEHICRLLTKMGIKKIRITGGEPLIRKDMILLIQNLRKIPELNELCLTTNGVLLSEMAESLKKAGVNRINVSLDTLNPQKYQAITSRPLLHQVLKGISAALRAGFSPLKLNVVVMKGINHLEMRDFIELAREKPLNIRFIEYMPFGTLSLAEATIPFSEMMESITALYELKPIPSPTSGTAGPAKDFHIKGFKGLVSFITPVTQPFCHKCNRLRITAQGDLKPCLLSAQGMNLKEALRNGTPTESMKALILKTLATKLSLRHPPEIEHMKDMASIGG